MNETNEIKEKSDVKKKTSKRTIILLVILILIIIGLSVFIVYDKLINTSDNKREVNKIKETETNKSNETDGKIESLKENIYYLYIDDDKYYFKFLNETEYECNVYDADNYDYHSKGTYEFDGKNIKISDDKIKLTFNDYMIYVNFNDNDGIDLSSEHIEYIYFNENVIKEEFKNIGVAAAEKRKNEWNNTHSEKIVNSEGSVEWCYKYDDDDKIACSINIKQYFEKYNKNECENNPTSPYQESVISSGECMDEYSTYWSFSNVEKDKNGYNISGSWTGI